MGSFSWNRADDLTNIENVAANTTFKFLIPAEFGGGFIKEKYQDYGFLGRKSDNSHKYDMYELLAQWNAPDLVIGCIHGTLKEVDENTEHNRGIGIDIGCYDDQIDNKYPACCPIAFMKIVKNLHMVILIKDSFQEKEIVQRAING